MSEQNMKVDHYAVLGVLPDAETVVITAAYRALVSLYHPDRWRSNMSEAMDRMAEINVAYGVLGDVVNRKNYDATCTLKHANFSDNEESQDAAFDAALGDLEQDWQIATEIYPDLLDIKSMLKKTSHKLAFAYVNLMLASKRFKERQKIAELMEAEFLSRYFGDHPEIVSFAKVLIYAGKRDGIKKLNRYVEVLGPELDADAIIKKIQIDFDIQDAKSRSDFPYGIKFVDGYYVFEHEMYIRLIDAINQARLVAEQRSPSQK